MRPVVVVLLLVAVLTVLAVPTAGAAPPELQGAAMARVVKRHGAAVRAAPSSDAAIFWVAACNDQFQVVGESSGWWEVALGNGGFGWIGGVRVAVAGYVPPVDCTGAVAYQVGSAAYARPTNCLSLRHWPSRDAPYEICVPWGYQYQIAGGPLDVVGEDWVQVWSPSTGGGWVLMDYLSPWP